MAKIQLGNTPKTFKRTIEIINIDSTVNTLEITYKYRTRRQLAEMIDKQVAAAMAEVDAEKEAAAAAVPAADEVGQPPAPAPAPPMRAVAEILAEQDAASASAVLDVAVGWDLDDPFNADTLMQLEDENPGSLFSITQAYRSAVMDVRAKN